MLSRGKLKRVDINVSNFLLIDDFLLSTVGI